MRKRLLVLMVSGVLTAALGVSQDVPASAGTILPSRIVATAITNQPANNTISRYGTRTSTTLSVSASGANLRYAWYAKAPGGTWRKISGAAKRSYTAKASKWSSGTEFRVKVSGSAGTWTSKAAKLTVLQPTTTPAKDAQDKFGLTGLRQGLDLSAYQYTPGGKINMTKVADWVGPNGFTIFRMGSGARPINQKVTDLCSGNIIWTKDTPGTRDCAYTTLAGKAKEQNLALGHYWFNGWTDRMDPTKANLFAAGYTAEDHAAKFVRDLIADGFYTKDSTDPLVLDIEPGREWTRTVDGKKYKATLSAWTSGEAADFLDEVRTLLTDKGYHANLYVYMSASRTNKPCVKNFTNCMTGFYWQPLASRARLWVASWGTDNGRIPDKQPATGPWTEWSIWQYSANVRIAGDGVGALDGDIAKADAWTPLP